MTRERIDSLEADKAWLREQVDRLRAEVDRLGPEVARLRESLSNTRGNGLLSTVLIAVGGGLVSYASFTGKVSARAADAGAGLLLSGVLIMLFFTIRSRPQGHRNQDR